MCKAQAHNNSGSHLATASKHGNRQRCGGLMFATDVAAALGLAGPKDPSRPDHVKRSSGDSLTRPVTYAMSMIAVLNEACARSTATSFVIPSDSTLLNLVHLAKVSLMQGPGLLHCCSPPMLPTRMVYLVLSGEPLQLPALTAF